MSNGSNLRITDYRTYGEDRPAGFIIETFRHWNGDEPSWGLPAWDEWGIGELAGVFPTRDAAQAAITDNGWALISNVL